MNGFITLENGENFSVRWTGYDEIIRIAIKELSFLDNPNEAVLSRQSSLVYQIAESKLISYISLITGGIPFWV